MPFDPLAPLPLLTGDLPGIGGRIKEQPEDFEVEEIPAYPPCGEGPFLYLWVEKRGMGAEYFLRQVARRLEVPPAEVGAAGLKDRHAVTRQRLSVPAEAEPRLPALEGDGIRLLEVSRHTNKLRPGHLHGNRFRILVRGVAPDAADLLPPLVERLRALGVPNYYGPQRFGRDGETYRMGRAILFPAEAAPGQRRPPGKGFLRKLAISAVQSALFNHYLARRLTDGLLHTVLAGDVMSHWPVGGLFVAEDLPAEQARFDARQIVTTGPIFGRKTYPARGEAARREEEVLAEHGLGPASFQGLGKLAQGTRRHNLVFLQDLEYQCEPEGAHLHFTLPAGSYATVLLREITRSSLDAGEEAG